MMEHIGLAAMLEVPSVFVDVQRGGPSTGLPTLPGQADMMQARWGSHGDYEIIAISPNSPQECFDLTILAFNLAEEYRVPVMFMMDECVGHMTEKVLIPPADEIEVTPRRYTTKKPGEYLPIPYKRRHGPGNGKSRRRVPFSCDGADARCTGLSRHECGLPGKARAQAGGQNQEQYRQDHPHRGRGYRRRRRGCRVLRHHVDESLCGPFRWRRRMESRSGTCG